MGGFGRGGGGEWALVDGCAGHGQDRRAAARPTGVDGQTMPSDDPWMTDGLPPSFVCAQFGIRRRWSRGSDVFGATTIDEGTGMGGWVLRSTRREKEVWWGTSVVWGERGMGRSRGEW